MGDDYVQKWFKSYYAITGRRLFLQQHGAHLPTREQRLTYLSLYNRELNSVDIRDYRQAISSVGFGMPFSRTEPSRGYGQGKSMYEIASRLED